MPESSDTTQLQGSGPPASPLDGHEEAIDSLYRDWTLVAAKPFGPWKWSTVKEPGPIALRARWHYLRGLDEKAGAADAPSHVITQAQWLAELVIETAGDAALVVNDLQPAREAFTTLLEKGSHPVTKIQAAIGIADVLRYDDTDLELTARAYSEAADLADRHRYAFGAMRAQLPLAYMVRRTGSAEQMLEMATKCLETARLLGDRVYIANSLVARGEALDLLGYVPGNRDRAVAELEEALELFTDVGAPIGIGSAGVRLLDVHRRRLDPSAIIELTPVVLEATRATGQVMETVDALDTLAFAHCEEGRFEEAVATCHEAIAVARSNYLRGAANARLTLGMALRLGGKVDEALAALQNALGFYDRRTERWMVAFCLGQLALCAEDLGSPADAARLQLRALEEIEGMRASQTRPHWQQEYRMRFDITYRAAMLTMLRQHDATGFVAVFESLWGRRLPGVSSGVEFDVAKDPSLLAQLLAQNERARRAALTVDEAATRSTRLRNHLGRTALGATLPDEYTEATDRALAATFTPMAVREAAALLDAVPDNQAVLLVCELPGAPRSLAWLTKLPGQTPRIGSRTLSLDEAQAVDAWTSDWPHAAVADDVTALSTLIPPELSAYIRANQLSGSQAVGSPSPAGPVGSLLIVPLEKLWGLPWSALSVGPRPDNRSGVSTGDLSANVVVVDTAGLGDRLGGPVGRLLGAALVLTHSPSLTLAVLGKANRLDSCALDAHKTTGFERSVLASRAARPTHLVTVAAIGPGVRRHDLRGLGALAVTARQTEAAQATYDALTHAESRSPLPCGCHETVGDMTVPPGAEHDTEGDDAGSQPVHCVIAVGHGRPTPALGHYLELSADLFVTPTDLLNSHPPPSVALIACWGAHLPGESTGEPLTLATIAQARGARQLLTTRTELGDTAAAAAIVNDVLHHATTRSWAAALHHTLRQREADLATEPLINWAALIAMGDAQ